MCFWQEITKEENCTNCPLFNEEHIQFCDDLEDVQDVINLIGLLEETLDKLEI